MKNVAVVVSESGQVHDLAIQPGTTAREVLDQIGVGDRYVLTTGRGQEPFGADENVYEAVNDGAKLYASTPVEVGGAPPPSEVALMLQCAYVGLPAHVLFGSQAEAHSGSFRSGLCGMLGLRRLGIGGTGTPSDAQGLLHGRSSRRQVVKRDTSPYWRQRGWRRSLCGDYTGWFRTHFGSWEGKAKSRRGGKVALLIRRPPDCLRDHRKWACFMPRPSGWYSVHVHGALCELSAGILTVERILTEAHQK